MTRSKKILNITTAIVVGLLVACTAASFLIRARTQPKVETVQPTQVSFALGQEWVDVLTVPRNAVLSESKSFFDEEGTEYTYEQYYVYVATSSLGLFGEVYDAERINVNPFPIENYAPEDYQPETGLYIRSGNDYLSLDGEDGAAYGWDPFAAGEDLMLLSGGGVNYWHKVIVSELDRVTEGTRVRMMPEKPEEKETLSVHASASGDKSSSEESGQNAGTDTVENTVDSGQEMEGGGTDYAGFAMPEETDALVLYSTDMLSITMRAAVDIFERLYPDVQIDWQRLSPEEYEARIRAEVPAGKGPDLLFTDMSVLPDVYKTMAAGLFEDLNPYLAADGEIAPDDFIRGIFDGGVLHGERTIAPVSHLSEILATSEELLSEIGTAPEDLDTFDGFLNACAKFHDLYPDGTVLADLGPHDNDVSMFSVLYTAAGFRMIDYENAAVLVDEAAFRKMADLCRLFAGNDPCQLDYTDGAYMSYGAILKREGMFTNFVSSTLMLDTLRYGLKQGGETAVLLTPPSAEGGKSTMICNFGAILKSSPNKRNAWRMLKILLSDEVQGNPEALSASPVRVSAVPLYVNYEYYDGFVVPDLTGYEPLFLDFDRVSIRPPVLLQSVWDEMKPYIKGEKAFDDCFGKMLNMLEIYKDE